MTNQSNTKTSITTPIKNQSALAKFQLGFEFDRSWTEAKQTVQHRPTKK